MTDPRKRRRRTAVKRRLVELAEYALTDVTLLVTEAEERVETIPCAYTWTGENITTSTLFLGRITGRTDPASVGKSPEQMDRFTIDGHIEIPGFDPADGGPDAEEAAEAALNALDEVLRACQRLAHEDVGSAMDPAEFFVTSCAIGDVEGPFHGFADVNSQASISGGVTFTFDVICDL